MLWRTEKPEALQQHLSGSLVEQILIKLLTEKKNVDFILIVSWKLLFGYSVEMCLIQSLDVKSRN